MTPAEEAAEALLGAAVRRTVKGVTDLLEADPHQWSTRPCQTCQAVSALAGYPFGCVRKRLAAGRPP